MSARPVIHATGQRFDAARPMWPSVFDWRGVRWPRTSAEAFRDAEYGCSVERFKPKPLPLSERIVIAVSLLSMLACSVMAWGGWLPGGGA